ncbi:MAG: cysteine desulfurase / selenocysteine lyase [archaeon GW2011_AR4]|nr:MAG: cysteine desulfurase / selenocysteine lyase [archaeon GW2011_AR4]
MIDNQKVRKDFPFLESGLIYFDNAATSQKPRQVIEKLGTFYEKHNANVHRGVYRLSEEATVLYENARKHISSFMNALPEEVIFTKNTTESLNLLAYSLKKSLRAGDEIVLTRLEHHSNLVPWQQVCKETGAILRYIELDKEGNIDFPSAEKMITKKTRIVATTYISNVLGTIVPVKEIVRLAGKAGAISIIDAAQAAPHMPIDVRDIGCDFLAFSAHKMLGPTGLGILYGKKERLESLPPFLFGGDMIESVTYENATWNLLPWKFEAGTPPFAEAVMCSAAIHYLEGIGMENIHLHEESLVREAMEQWKTVPGLRIIGPKKRAGIISFTIDGMHHLDSVALLDKENIAVRAGHHCAMPLMHHLGLKGSVRASFYLYNTKEEIKAVTKVLKKIQKIR